MTVVEIKEKLKSLQPCKTDFNVILTGKKSKVCNGFYTIADRTICLNNLNFRTEHEMMGTAIHEYTHHLLGEADSCQSLYSGRHHGSDFYALNNSLLRKAKETGVLRFRHEEDESFMALVDELKKIDSQIQQLKREYGKILEKIHNQAVTNGYMMKAVFSENLKIDEVAARKIMAASRLPEVGSFLIQDFLSVPDKEKTFTGADIRECEGLSAAEVREKLKKKKNEGSNTEKLIAEKKRIENQITRMRWRLDEITKLIESNGESGADDVG